MVLFVPTTVDRHGQKSPKKAKNSSIIMFRRRFYRLSSKVWVALWSVAMTWFITTALYILGPMAWFCYSSEKLSFWHFAKWLEVAYLTPYLPFSTVPLSLVVIVWVVFKYGPLWSSEARKAREKYHKKVGDLYKDEWAVQTRARELQKTDVALREVTQALKKNIEQVATIETAQQMRLCDLDLWEYWLEEQEEVLRLRTAAVAEREEALQLRETDLTEMKQEFQKKVAQHAEVNQLSLDIKKAQQDVMAIKSRAEQEAQEIVAQARSKAEAEAKQIRSEIEAARKQAMDKLFALGKRERELDNRENILRCREQELSRARATSSKAQADIARIRADAETRAQQISTDAQTQFGQVGAKALPLKQRETGMITGESRLRAITDDLRQREQNTAGQEQDLSRREVALDAQAQTPAHQDKNHAQVTAAEQRILDYLARHGGVATRKGLLGARLYPSGRIDRIIDALLVRGLITCDDAAPVKNDWIYTLTS